MARWPSFGNWSDTSGYRQRNSGTSERWTGPLSSACIPRGCSKVGCQTKSISRWRKNCNIRKMENRLLGTDQALADTGRGTVDHQKDELAPFPLHVSHGVVPKWDVRPNRWTGGGRTPTSERWKNPALSSTCTLCLLGKRIRLRERVGCRWFVYVVNSVVCVVRDSWCEYFTSLSTFSAVYWQKGFRRRSVIGREPLSAVGGRLVHVVGAQR
jgi:hypothetical protein